MSPDGQPVIFRLRRAGATARSLPIVCAPDRCALVPQCGPAGQPPIVTSASAATIRGGAARRGCLSPPAGTASHAARRPPPGLLEPDCELSPLPPPPRPVPPSRAAAKAVPTAAQSGQGRAGHGALGAAARLGFCYAVTGVGRSACSPGRQQQWPMVVSELVRGRHLSRGAEPGASPIQLPRSGIHSQTGSLQRSDFPPRHRGALWSGVAPENPALLKWGEWSDCGNPQYSREGAHSHLAPPFFLEPQIQPHGGSHTTGFPASGSEGPGVSLERRQEEGGTPKNFTRWVGMDCRPGFLLQAAGKQALRAKVDI